MPNLEDLWVHIEFFEELDEDESGTGKVSFICDGGQTITGEYNIHNGLASGSWDKLFRNESYFDDEQALIILAVAANFYKDEGNGTNWEEFWAYALGPGSPLDDVQKRVVTRMAGSFVH